MVDNCYGEFIETIEPSDVGADMVVGSLIKNPGGGLAPVGGYICGKKSMWIMRHSDLQHRDLEVNWERLLVLIPRFIRDFSCTYGISRCIKGAILRHVFMKNLDTGLFRTEQKNVMISYRQLSLKHLKSS